jgi:NADH:ubiquinone oxidoreductase subunit 5 (subunit L)/multisubunit Na+/H+ antiporter MnhA subunit
MTPEILHLVGIVGAVTLVLAGFAGHTVGRTKGIIIHSIHGTGSPI